MITSVAVVSSPYNSSVTPLSVFNSYRHTGPRDAIPKLTNTALSCDWGKTDKSSIIGYLKSGKTVVIKVFGSKKGGRSSYTSSQHYMALIDINGNNVFVGNSYSTSEKGRDGWHDIDKVLVSIQTAEVCGPR
jgi:hypothetical protein